jgi:hypothetical protein
MDVNQLRIEIVPQSLAEAARKKRHPKTAQNDPKRAAALTPERRRKEIDRLAPSKQ